MLKELLDAFREEGVLTRLLGEFDEMLKLCEENFILLNPEKLDPSKMGKLREPIFSNDKKINQLERGIRYKILRHLTVAPDQDASTCMVFMVVSKDAERIGDYSKNIFEILEACGPERFKQCHNSDLLWMRTQIEAMLIQCRTAFRKSDTKLAKSLSLTSQEISKKADELVHETIESTDQNSSDSTVQALLARYYKRSSSHLSNICTAITAPVDMLGYHDES